MGRGLPFKSNCMMIAETVTLTPLVLKTDLQVEARPPFVGRLDCKKSPHVGCDNC